MRVRNVESSKLEAADVRRAHPVIMCVCESSVCFTLFHTDRAQSPPAVRRDRRSVTRRVSAGRRARTTDHATDEGESRFVLLTSAVPRGGRRAPRDARVRDSTDTQVCAERPRSTVRTSRVRTLDPRRGPGRARRPRPRRPRREHNTDTGERRRAQRQRGRRRVKEYTRRGERLRLRD